MGHIHLYRKHCTWKISLDHSSIISSPPTLTSHVPSLIPWPSQDILPLPMTHSPLAHHLLLGIRGTSLPAMIRQNPTPHPRLLQAFPLNLLQAFPLTLKGVLKFRAKWSIVFNEFWVGLWLRDQMFYLPQRFVLRTHWDNLCKMLWKVPALNYYILALGILLAVCWAILPFRMGSALRYSPIYAAPIIFPREEGEAFHLEKAQIICSNL